MGGAKFLGNVKELPKTSCDYALGFFLIWVVFGLGISFGLSLIFFQIWVLPILPILMYGAIGAFLFWGYIREANETTTTW